MSETLTIQTKNGPIQGIKKTSDCGYDYYSFQRIPYAKAPVGQLRFKDPEPIDDWIEVIDATNQGQPCYGKNILDNSVQGDDDSLHINVFTKSVSNEIISIKFDFILNIISIKGKTNKTTTSYGMDSRGSFYDWFKWY